MTIEQLFLKIGTKINRNGHKVEVISVHRDGGRDEYVAELQYSSGKTERVNVKELGW